MAIFFFWPIPGPDDMINIIIGGYFSAMFQISLIDGIFLTYTALPLVLLYLGCVVSPKDTNSTFNGVLRKIRNVLYKIISDPRLMVAAIAMIIILYYVYILYIADMIARSIV